MTSHRSFPRRQTKRAARGGFLFTKMIPLLQTRFEDGTIVVDGSRPKKSALTPELRRKIEPLAAIERAQAKPE